MEKDESGNCRVIAPCVDRRHRRHGATSQLPARLLGHPRRRAGGNPFPYSSAALQSGVPNDNPEVGATKRPIGLLAYDAQLPQASYDVIAQFLAAPTASRVLKIYREGLLPYARASRDSRLSAYVLLDLSHLDEKYWQMLAQHESAIARAEQLTGVSLP